VWVFGIIGEVTKRCKLFIVEARNAEQLGAIVAAHIGQGRNNQVHIDGWGAYRRIDW